MGEFARSHGLEDLADLAEVVAEEGTVPLSQDDAARPEEYADEQRASASDDPGDGRERGGREVA